MSRTHVPDPESYVNTVVKRMFDDNEWYSGKITSYTDRYQMWHVEYDDGDSEDWTVPDMKLLLPGFKCGRFVDGVYEHSAEAIRTRNRQRRETGRREDQVEDVLSELMLQKNVAQSAKEFQMPDHYDQAAKTVWRMIRVFVERDGSRWAAVMPKDDVTHDMLDEVDELTMDELENLYDVTIAPLAKVQEWIQKSFEVHMLFF